MSTAVAMVRAGLGISILPASAVNTASCEGVLARPLRTPGLTRKIAIVRKPDLSLSAAAERFVDVLKEVAKLPLPHFASAPAATASIRRHGSKRGKAQ